LKNKIYFSHGLNADFFRRKGAKPPSRNATNGNFMSKQKKVFPIHIDDFGDTMNSESHRGCVLIGCHVLDIALEHRIRSRLVRRRVVLRKAVNPLFESTRPLSSFWSKIQLAYALNLLDDWVYDDLETIRRIRNALAHSHDSFSFDAPVIQELVHELQSPRRGLGHPRIWSLARTLQGCQAFVDEFSPNAKSLNQAFFLAGFHYLHGYLTKGVAYKNRG
jgi:DNA-binding MltR family transcriptional regulator